ncbi:carbohydrate ABC transporter permease [Protaetiibacter mangrovi]|uniref:Carbohydrate ABC transporter permease n=1 Tax=Protaetiibacter mangrovi TaxID=2970926 RepID=A0ABT1ZHA5_9MICO|nr:carbohydrate ABC transporter permease [Protaetiibacter mangrovi]MCS0500092.1 carbohydrate ABC transporter permease [Protaetiibacter mangrovi]TPX03634.1 carbohydrate ABC transporter permease [Schumannella luteola]
MTTTPSIAPVRPTRRRRGRAGARAAAVVRHAVLIPIALLWLVPLYVVIINAFKTNGDIVAAPFEIPFDRISLEYLQFALVNPNFNVVGAYGYTALLVVVNIVLLIVIAGPVSYVISRGLNTRHRALLFYFLLGTFIPGQAILIPATTVLRTLGLMNSFPGLVLFQVVAHLPVTIFLFVGYIRSIPRSIDEAAIIDGAGMLRRYWSVIFPLMRPIVATVVILTGMGVWNDFVHPQIILGPFSPKTVTTGIYAAFGLYVNDYTIIFPDLLLAIAPLLIFFVFMQRHIVSGLTTGALKS